ncbi:hypothetical protein OSB04_un000438 [Centaurea solstitialis]|uniref:Reverse transcriptase Ty1/copia-type domain-containing protein n=1 Tax=Centaurea solstitialis TaxID=347529 RepID=A0AA38SQH4_9ASTR|nr:hypothetical protein OSB04_un000438 [Centaurea solstitialis]
MWGKPPPLRYSLGDDLHMWTASCFRFGGVLHVPTLQSVKSWLSKCFQMKDLGEAAYILGIKIYRNRSKRLIRLSQSTYIDKILKKFRMDESKKGFIPMQHGIVLCKYGLFLAPKAISLLSKSDKFLQKTDLQQIRRKEYFGRSRKLEIHSSQREEIRLDVGSRLGFPTREDGGSMNGYGGDDSRGCCAKPADMEINKGLIKIIFTISFDGRPGGEL